MPYPRLTKCMPDESRYNPLYYLHKAIRYGHCRMLAALGAQDFTHDAVAQLQHRLTAFLGLSRAALEAERTVLSRAIEAGCAASAAPALQEFDSHGTALSEIESLIRAAWRRT